MAEKSTKKVVVSAEKKAFTKDDFVKKLDEIKKGLKNLGHEGIEISKKLEKELVKGQRLVKSMVDVGVLKGKKDKLLKELGSEIYKNDPSKEIIGDKAADIIKQTKKIDADIETKQSEIDKLKKKK